MNQCIEEKDDQFRCSLCSNCRQLTINATSEVSSDLDKDPKEKCNRWLEKCNGSDCESVITCSEDASCVSELTDECSSCSEFTERDLTISNKILTPFGELEINDFNNVTNTYKNVNITKSKNIHLGNITYINGPVYVNQSATVINTQTTVNQVILNQNDDDFIPPRILDRKNWLAQPPSGDKEFLEGPAKLVIICHTATEEGYTQPDNILLIRLIQQFHIESRKWNDIGYHYLIGADGNIYEGRGWRVRGAHTYGYNGNSIGIAFVGCFTDHLPPAISLENAKRLIEFGVRLGTIDANYQLLAHSQCSTTESPGRTLYAELQTWSHWNPDVSVGNPSIFAWHFQRGAFPSISLRLSNYNN